jgi:two-component system, OmpR family, response regulator
VQILIVEDDPTIASAIARALAGDGHMVSIAESLAEARKAPFRILDLVILDFVLSDGSGIELIHQLRQAEQPVRILVLTAHTSVHLRVAALEAGADDYIGKPFEFAELRARVRALGRRGPIWRAPVHVHNDVRLDFDCHRATRGDVVVPLTAREWGIMEFLTTRAGRFNSREDLLTAVWGDATKSAGNSLDVLLVRLRRKLGSDIIETMRGLGYALGGTLPPPQPAAPPTPPPAADDDDFDD